MFTIYHSNDLDVQKELLLRQMAIPLSDPLQPEIVLVQSPGMAQWLQWKIAEAKGIASNIQFPMPASFIWQQYATNLPNVESENPFNKTAMTWRLMRLLPQYFSFPEFQSLKQYFSDSQCLDNNKLYQLAYKIADLFDQYLVYRPEWIKAWEQQQEQKLFAILALSSDAKIQQQIWRDLCWQGMLWRGLVQDIQQVYTERAWHRADLQQQFLQVLQQGSAVNLPERIFIFGISALPLGYLDSLYAMSKHCDVHLFFTDMCKYYWGDLSDPRFVQKLRLQKRENAYQPQQKNGIFEPKFYQSKVERNPDAENQYYFTGHSLLASWGKLGRDFLYLLTELEQQKNVYGIEAYVHTEQQNASLLAQLQTRILTLDSETTLNLIKNDRSFSVHSCHSPMREVEVLHDYLLHLLQDNPSLTPKDIVVMMADIDHYTPYIQAVFGQKFKDEASAIPFSITDNKLSENDVLIASFLQLLAFKQQPFSAENVLALLDVPAIRAKFQIHFSELAQLRHWVEQSNIRLGLDKYQENQQPNYNSWQSGLENMLLGYAMREENGIWQDSLGFDSSYGLQGQVVGKLCEFIECLQQWQDVLQRTQSIYLWQQDLIALVQNVFLADEKNTDTLFYLQHIIEQKMAEIEQTGFQATLTIDVIAEVLNAALQNEPDTMRFLVGKVNFCTLLPMRSIPFKVVCLLGMNEQDYPRQHTPNSFDLMQYDRRKGDRFRRDDDCYLFLEALMSAQDYFYVSFLGRSIIDNSEKNPSVLVSQLLDYIVENLPSESPKSQMDFVQQHTMAAFDPQNFLQTDRSFAQQWLPLAKVHKLATPSDFLQPINYQLSDSDRQIRLTDLIRFVQNPVAFFFKQRLGIFFPKQQESIPERENFELDGLSSYAIKNALLYCDPKQEQQLFEQLKVKGILPRGEFAYIHHYQQQENIRAFKQKMHAYLQQVPTLQEIDLTFSTAQGNFYLRGHLTHLYDQQMIRWHAGNLADKHLIELWISYLVQCAMTDERVAPPIFYAIKNSKTFTPLEENAQFSVKQQALQQLQIYIESYMAGYQQLQLVPTGQLESYLSKISIESAVDFDKLQHFLQLYAEGSQYEQGDIYWQRVLAQQTLDEALLAQIHQQWLNWFEGLSRHLQNVGKLK